MMRKLIAAVMILALCTVPAMAEVCPNPVSVQEKSEVMFEMVTPTETEEAAQPGQSGAEAEQAALYEAESEMMPAAAAEPAGMKVMQADPAGIFQDLNWQSDAREVLEACAGNELVILRSEEQDYMSVILFGSPFRVNLILRDDELKLIGYSISDADDNVFRNVLGSFVRSYGEPCTDPALFPDNEYIRISQMINSASAEEEGAEQDAGWWQKTMDKAVWLFSNELEQCCLWEIDEYTQMILCYYKSNTFLTQDSLCLFCMPVE